MDLLEKSRNTLELPAVLEMLAGEAVSEPAKAEALALVPSVHRAEVERLLAETSDAKDMMVYKGSPSLSGLRDVSGSLARADMGGVLNTRELLEIAGVLQSARAVRSYGMSAEKETCIDHLFGTARSMYFSSASLYCGCTPRYGSTSPRMRPTTGAAICPPEI